MKEQIKSIIKEMIKNGELKVALEWESLWADLYVTLSLDGEELAKESVRIEELNHDKD